MKTIVDTGPVSTLIRCTEHTKNWAKHTAHPKYLIFNGRERSLWNFQEKRIQMRPANCYVLRRQTKTSIHVYVRERLASSSSKPIISGDVYFLSQNRKKILSIEIVLSRQRCQLYKFVQSINSSLSLLFHFILESSWKFLSKICRFIVRFKNLAPAPLEYQNVLFFQYSKHITVPRCNSRGTSNTILHPIVIFALCRLWWISPAKSVNVACTCTLVYSVHCTEWFV